MDIRVDRQKSNQIVLLMISVCVLVALMSIALMPKTVHADYKFPETHVPGLLEVINGASKYYRKPKPPEIQIVKIEPEPIPVSEPEPEPVSQPVEVVSPKDYVYELCETYTNVRPEVVFAIVELESHWNADAKNGKVVGLMQINPSYQKQRMAELGVSDLSDPYSNLKVGVDFLSDLIRDYGNEQLALMLYSMRWDDAFAMWKAGQVSNYVKLVYSMAGGATNG